MGSIVPTSALSDVGTVTMTKGGIVKMCTTDHNLPSHVLLVFSLPPPLPPKTNVFYQHFLFKHTHKFPRIFILQAILPFLTIFIASCMPPQAFPVLCKWSRLVTVDRERDPFWGPLTLPLQWVPRAPSPLSVQDVTLTTHLQHVPKHKCVDLYLYPPQCFHSTHTDNLTVP